MDACAETSVLAQAFLLCRGVYLLFFPCIQFDLCVLETGTSDMSLEYSIVYLFLFTEYSVTNFQFIFN